MTVSPDAIRIGNVQIEVSDFVSQGNAILGIRDSGKSYTATWLAEQMLMREIPFVAFDPIGVWRFLRHGERPWQVLVAGGEGADVPLTEDNAADIVRHAMVNNIPLVLDLYDVTMSKAQWRRIVSDCVRVMLYENKKHGRRHIFIEEAAEFVPQMVGREHGQVYAEIEKLARMGGNAMLGYTLINQRAEQVNKAVLELCDCLFLHRQKGRLSLTALGKWLDFGDKKASGQIIASLPKLRQGECWIWQGGSDTPEIVDIPEKQSYHPNRRMATDPGKAVPVPQMLKGLNLFSKTEEQKGPAAQANTRIIGSIGEPIIQKVPVFEPGDLAKLQTLATELNLLMVQSEAVAGALNQIARAVQDSLKRADALGTPRHVPAPKVRAEGIPTVLAAGPQKILSTLANRHPLTLTQAQLGTISGYTPSTMRTYLPGLREAGLLREDAAGIGLTVLGVEKFGVNGSAMPTTGKDLLDFWCVKLSQGEAVVLRALYHWRNTGRVGTVEELQERTSYTASTIRTYLPTLRRNNLIHPKELLISEEFTQ